MGSSRLPGKVMKPILGKPLLGHLLDRIQCCHMLDEVLVATSISADNDVIASYCAQRGVPVFRGSETDVLSRLVRALDWRGAQVGVLVFGDCPLIDPMIIRDILSGFMSDNKYDFVSNDLSTSWPPGMEVEIFKVSALRDSDRRCTDQVVREHGTLYLRQNPDIYSQRNIDAPQHLSRLDLSFEVDVIEDLQVVETILSVFTNCVDIGLAKMIRYMDDHPELAAHNRHVPRLWKQYRKN